MRWRGRPRADSGLRTRRARARRSAFEEHLGSCATCREELAALQEVAYSRRGRVPAPPPGCAGGSSSRLERSARTSSRSRGRRRRRGAGRPGSSARRPPPRRPGDRPRHLGRDAAHDLSAERSAHSRLAQALAIAASPGSAHVDLTGANGSLAVAPSGRGVLVIPDLEKAPAGKTYEAWVIRGSKPSPAGLFRGGGSTGRPRLAARVPGSSSR